MNNKVEKFRCKTGLYATAPGDNKGLFFVTLKPGGKVFKVLCSPFSESVWDHVSISLSNRCPTWNEMSKLKAMFFGEDVTVVQYHPKKSEYVNNHPYCLHLWKHVDGHDLPPSGLIGVK